MIFLTLGTYPLPFDRLVSIVDEIVKRKVIEDEIFAQIGYSTYIPKHMKYEKLMEKERFDSVLSSASALIGHAGMGSISMALNCRKSLLVMPRLKQYGEHVNDHQVSTARKFEELGHILAAYDEKELVEKIKLLKTFVPKPRIPNRQGVIDRISRFLESLS
jgi:UDP-N-acetylglucosamine transferase subunit ALG13